jgi:outer membrane protein, heavy metal efflux system
MVLIRIFICVFIMLHAEVTAQVVLSEQEAVARTVKNSPVLKAAGLELKSMRQLRGASFNPANPELLIESPTGEFMTLGISQTFDFPTVYTSQGKLARQQVKLSEIKEELSLSEVIHAIKSVYLDLQFALADYELLKKQDSAFSNIAVAAERQFTAGQIDFVSRTSAVAEYGEVHNRFLQAAADAASSAYQLKIYTGISDSIIIDALDANTRALLQFDSSDYILSPLMKYSEQSVVVANKELKVQRNKVLPGFTLGYLNPGGSEVDFPMRLRAGITIPLWFWQYNASVKSAKTNVEIAQQQLEGQKQELAIRLDKQLNDALKYKSMVDYYSSKGVKEAGDLNSSAVRMFNAGQIDYINYLRTLSSSYEIMRKNLEAIRNYNQTIININYLISRK